MTQSIMEIYDNKELIQWRMFRLHRHLKDHDTKLLYLDIPYFKDNFSDIIIKFWNSGGDKKIDIYNLKLEAIYEK